MKFFVTTPIYYVNDVPHIGHVYTTFAADMLARYHRFIGDETYFLTGTDEHGAKIAEAAVKNGKQPKEFADEVSQSFKSLWQTMDISYDRFIRTTDVDHEKTVVDFLNRLHKTEYVYKGEYEGLYCRGCEEFKKESDLVEGKCPIHNREAEKVAEPAYFFKLSAFKEKLIQLIVSDTIRIEPQIRKHEVLAFLEGQDLEDTAISRRNVAWGIPVPWDTDHTIYVWVDALINYYTAGKPKGFWPPTWELIGKDILRFHCIIWPALLLALEEELPRGFFIHGFFTIDGKKMSKSLGNTVDPEAVVKEYGIDGLRHFLFKAFPFGADGDFSHSLLKETYNSGLSNELGNLVQRVLVMTEKYRQGVVPEVKNRGSNVETAIVADSWSKWHESLRNLHFDEAFKGVWDLVTYANRLIDDTKPWDLAKTDQAKLDEVLYELLEIIRHIALQLQPLLPHTSTHILERLGFTVTSTQNRAEFDTIQRWGILEPGSKTQVLDVLFPRKA